MTMPSSLIVYFDYKSPYAFVAKAPIYQLEKDFGLEVEWRPYSLHIPDFLGSVDVDADGKITGGTRNEHQWRRTRYLYMDARRLAKDTDQDLMIKGPARVYNSKTAHIGMLFAKREGFFRPYHDLVFDRFWKRELDIDDADAVAAAVAEAGGDGDGFKTYLAGEGVKEHDRIIEKGNEIGIFGVPSFVLDGELFWGNEHLPSVRKRLAA
ncbi:MAG: disulfide bond formation protein DsbA [Rhodospirillaceae bacterium]|nr:disulfide bond formation protein DsbA [Rhodospirillaceae bacterium]|tara:strand:+ start:252 stop:878 length:627 start_codon:yes stop_codon:yes gene_type:complete